MRTPLRHLLPCCLASLVCLALAAGCRDKATSATADPASDQASPRRKPTGGEPKPIDVDAYSVTTNEVTIPRTGHDPIVLKLPVVKGTRDPSIDAKIDSMLAPEKILGESLDDVRAEAKAVTSAADLATGVQGAGYEVLYQKHGILEIEAFTELMGAYPSSSRFHLLVDVSKGEPLGEQAFLPGRVPGLVKRVDAMLKAEVAKAAKDPDFGDLAKDAKFEAKDLWDFSVSDEGLTFNYDYGFPHVALGLQPPGRFFLPWSEAAADVDPAGALARVHPLP